MDCGRAWRGLALDASGVVFDPDDDRGRGTQGERDRRHGSALGDQRAVDFDAVGREDEAATRDIEEVAVEVARRDGLGDREGVGSRDGHTLFQ